MPIRLLGQPREPQRTWTEAEVIWGVPLREGYSDDDDPRAHQGVAQHAFEVQNDERAICGFEPPKRPHATYRSARPRLGLPNSLYNPRCKRCAPLVVGPAEEAAADQAQAAAPEAGEPTTETEQPTPEVVAPMPEVEAPMPDEEPTDVADVTEAPARPAPVTVEPDVVEIEAPGKSRSTGGSRARSPDQAAHGLAGAADTGWQGSLVVPAGNTSAVIESGDPIGGQVVARVVRGPKGVNVKSVSVDEGVATITLNASAEEPVTVAWLVVPDLGVTGGNAG